MILYVIYCYLIAFHASHAFHMRLCPMSCQSYKMADLAAEAPAEDVEEESVNIVNLYHTLPFSGKRKLPY